MTDIRFTRTESLRIRSGTLAAAADLGLELTNSVAWGMDPTAWATIENHVASSQSEVAGLLVGRVWADQDGYAVIIDAAIPATDHVETSGVHVSFRPEAWDVLSTHISERGEDTLIVGWYHSHPGLGAFFSGTDRHTQAAFFREPWQLGIVVDAKRPETALFAGPASEPIAPHQLKVIGQGPASVPAAGSSAEIPGLTPAPVAGAPRLGDERAAQRQTRTAVAVTALILVVVFVRWRIRRRPTRASPLDGAPR